MITMPFSPFPFKDVILALSRDDVVFSRMLEAFSL